MRGESPRAGRIGLVLVLLVAAGALAFRLPQLDRRPMHGDEANQAVKTGILLDTGVYTYDPVEHHGPTLYYLTLPVIRLTGAADFAHTTEFTYRIVPVLFGVGIILLLIPLRGTLGVPALVATAALTAVSPAMVYYSRYYIQETLLVCFVFGAIVCGWRYTQLHSLGWALAAGVFAGLAHASKETCIIAFGAIGVAAAAAVGWARFIEKREPHATQSWKAAHVAAFLGAAIVVSVLFYSSFFTHPRGVLDSVLTYANYFRKADSGHIHDKPWYYYLQILSFTRRTPKPWFSEGLILGLGTVGILAALVGRKKEAVDPGRDIIRFLAFYAVAVTVVYSLIPYKTPWNAINFLQPLIVLAGFGAVVLVRALRFRVVQAAAAIVLILAAGQLGLQAYRAAYIYDADVRNPYVYAHTAKALLRLVDRVEAIAAVNPEDGDMLIRVISPEGDYWPLPWYLRRFTRVGYWTEIPDNADAAVIIAPAKLAPEVDPHLTQSYQSEYYSLRPGRLLVARIRADLWEAFMKPRR